MIHSGKCTHTVIVGDLLELLGRTPRLTAKALQVKAALSRRHMRCNKKMRWLAALAVEEVTIRTGERQDEEPQERVRMTEEDIQEIAEQIRIESSELADLLKNAPRDTKTR